MHVVRKWSLLCRAIWRNTISPLSKSYNISVLHISTVSRLLESSSWLSLMLTVINQKVKSSGDGFYLLTVAASRVVLGGNEEEHDAPDKLRVEYASDAQIEEHSIQHGHRQLS